MSWNSCEDHTALVIWFLVADIDECLTESGLCSHVCVNDPGMYHCECYPGYVLAVDETACTGEACCMCVF